MSTTISASVSESFELTVSPSEGFTGEHNAETLEINISALIQSGYDYYTIIFDDTSINGVKKSNEIRGSEDYPAYLADETVFCPLSSQLTSTGRLKIQLEAHKLTSADSQIKKTSVASIEFKPSIMSGTDYEFDASSSSRLDKLETGLRSIEAQLKKMSTIPLATTGSIGGIMLDSASPVQLDENGSAILSYYNFNAEIMLARLLIEILAETDQTQILCVKSCDDVSETLDGLTFDLNIGTYSCIAFCTETSGKTHYCDGSYETVELNAAAGTIYIFKGHEDTFSMTQYNKYSFRKLLLEGVL